MLRLTVSLLLGAIIGLERERQERAAGLRTVTMVSLGSCLFTIVGAYGFSQTDPSRVAAQIVTGIGFLGAGTIFLRKDLVRGLTTAATIWATAAIGMAAATAQYFEAAFTTLLILAVLMVLKPIERRFFKRPNEATVSLILPRSDTEIERVRSALGGRTDRRVRGHDRRAGGTGRFDCRRGGRVAVYRAERGGADAADPEWESAAHLGGGGVRGGISRGT